MATAISITTIIVVTIKLGHSPPSVSLLKLEAYVSDLLMKHAPHGAVIALRVAGSATRGSRSTFLTLWKPCTLLTSTCSPSVSTQVWVSWVEPSGIVVAM